MADFSSTNVEAIVSICSENSAAIAESLNQCFDSQQTLTVGEPADWMSDYAPSELAGPGLLVCCRVGDESLVCAIPASLPLPEWYTEPGDSQSARLDTLAMEWSMNLLPPDIECEEFTTTAHANLLTAMAQPGSETSATILPVTVDEDQSGLWIVWPLPAAATASASAEPANEKVAETAVEAPVAAAASSPKAPPPVDPLARIRGINVPVIVKLAERRIEIDELLHLCPGTIVSFDKPCEDLLELMVSNQMYARGEAVKIGEKFGIKISEVGYVPRREPRIIS
ncbi:Flagellar motor switch protein FliN [Symmachiella macrocystis]|uniref:Flagellar motor switch protein FliN n=1 Tax=Symmachiella macrocystis TaxID=2527985 RepID=A0A5C6BQ38_9PLAN|nr:FliM/FliN family flagellar motor C-terminal domain-containing protein [Symmachiella macrocystis]TWU13511.1 Flagellar motor switch protein FliN [Symmachiella macrocystis]